MHLHLNRVNYSYSVHNLGTVAARRRRSIGYCRGPLTVASGEYGLRMRMDQYSVVRLANVIIDQLMTG